MSTPIEYRRRGQAVWLDTISSKMIHSGRLSSLIEAGSIYGVTSNPTIFGQAIEKNEGDYNAATRAPRARGEGRLRDLRRAHAGGHRRGRGRVSRDARPRTPWTAGSRSRCSLPRGRHGEDRRRGEASLDGARPAERLHQGARDARGRPRGPAPDRRRRVSINITLMFNRKHYREVANAYLGGLSDFAAKGGDLSRVHSVASFFVSRVDTLVDKLLGEKARRPRERRRRGSTAFSARRASRTQGRLPGLPRDLRRRAVRLPPREGRRASSGRSGRPRARRTPPIRICSTWRTSSAPTP